MFGSIGAPEMIIIGVVVLIGYGLYRAFTREMPVGTSQPSAMVVTTAATADDEALITNGLKRCPFCAEEIQAAAIVCKHCGRALAPGVPSAGVAAPPSLGVAAVLSLVIPGAGQLYKGQVLGGLCWFVAVITGYVALVVPGLLLHACCIVGAATTAPRR